MILEAKLPSPWMYLPAYNAVEITSRFVRPMTDKELTLSWRPPEGPVVQPALAIRFDVSWRYSGASVHPTYLELIVGFTKMVERCPQYLALRLCGRHIWVLCDGT